VTDAAGRVLWASDAIERLVGVPAERIAGTPLADHLTYRDEAREALIEILGRHGARGAIDTVAHTADGRAIDVAARVTNLLEDPGVRGMVINLRDVSERTALERDLRHQALHDPLTGLANRTLFEDRLTRAVATSRRSGRTLGVLFCDLDDFKTINDSLGHDTGDALLMELGRRFDAVLRSGDSVARLGGDEFAVLIEEACEPGTAVAVAERLLDAIRRPVVVGGRELAVHASVGIAIGDGRTDAQALLREADVAMYAAKADGKSRWRLFEPGMHDAVVRRLELRADLGFALERGELTLAYQPIVAVDSERIAGVEALLRWQHPERGTVSPAEFIPEAEETGLIVPIGRWVLEEATRRLAAWKREQPDRAPGYVSVNVAGRQLSDPAFTGDVAAALEHSGLHPGELVLEVTESSMIDDGAAEMRLSELHDLGVRLAIDDFGSGYSALNYLRRFPLDILKIDRQFVQGLTTVPQDTALTGAMIAMAYALGLDVIAEGVEDAGQLDELRSLQCGLAQGYLFSRPVGPDELMAALAYAG
jgi:diguanylate cyclase (GGDEF)-like protein/PAS domain S-box-containing protein